MSQNRLRPRQQGAIEAARSWFAAGHQRVLVALPTGSGATAVLADLARREVEAGRRVLVLVYRKQDVEPTAEEFRALGMAPGFDAGKAGQDSVVVASMQSLRGQRLWTVDQRAFRLVILPDAHHAAKWSYKMTLAYLHRAKVLGAIASHLRTDQKAFREVFPACAYRYEDDVASSDEGLYLTAGWAGHRGRA